MSNAIKTAKAIADLYTPNRVDQRVKLSISEDGVKEVGVSQAQGVVVARNETTVVVKWRGFSFNPGSKFSGLTTYVPTHISVYLIDEIKESGIICAGLLIDYDSRSKRN